MGDADESGEVSEAASKLEAAQESADVDIKASCACARTAWCAPAPPTLGTRFCLPVDPPVPRDEEAPPAAPAL